MPDRNPTDVYVRQGLVVGVGLVAIVVGLIMHATLLSMVGVAMIVFAIAYAIATWRRARRDR